MNTEILNKQSELIDHIKKGNKALWERHMLLCSLDPAAPNYKVLEAGLNKGIHERLPKYIEELAATGWEDCIYSQTAPPMSFCWACPVSNEQWEEWKGKNCLEQKCLCWTLDKKHIARVSDMIERMAKWIEEKARASAV